MINVDKNPLFIDPISPTSAPTVSGNLRLGEGSPAINAGNNDFVSSLPTDLDGNDRIVAVLVDIGAYEADTLYLLSVSKTGAGSGTVTSSLAGINCGVDCSESYPHDTVVTLTAAADSGSTFAGWSSACSGDGDCQLTMDAAKDVTAVFDLEPAFEINLPLVKR